MTKTKAKLLAVSRDLFNEKGYGNVTIRMIALRANMSSGNLNYHFKKKEDILEALYFEMVQVFDERLKQLTSTELTMEKSLEDLIQSLKRMVSYRFFWTDLYNLLRTNQAIKSHFEGVHSARLLGCKLLFKAWNEQGLMHAFSFDKEADFLAERMITFGNTWLYNSFIYEEEINEEYIQHQAANYLSMLYPYFTDLGKEQFKGLFPAYLQ